MTDLLKLAIEAHGGLDRWSRVTRIEAQASIGGAVWASKGQRGILDDVRVRADPRTREMPPAPSRKAVTTPAITRGPSGTTTWSPSSLQ